MTQEEIDRLYRENVEQFAKMDRDAGNMVKQLLWELQAENRDAYIRLRDAVSDGSVVFYDMVQGDPELVKGLAETLGFTSWDSNRLEV